MKRTRQLSLIFIVANMILAGALSWGGYVFYHWQEQRIADNIAGVISTTAQKVQVENMILNNLAGLMNDSMREEKLSFAAGMTSNMGKMRQWFDDDLQWEQEQIDKQNYKARVHKKGSEVIIVNSAFLKDRDIQFEPTAVQDISFFDSLLKKAWDTNNIKANYLIHRLTSQDTSYSTPYKHSSRGFIINFYDPKIYRVDYTVQPASLLVATLPYIALCTILFILLLLSYLLLMRSFKMQAQSALFREMLFSNITHELKTPLSSLQLILHRSGTSTRQDISAAHLDFANRELDRMKLLIDKIISFGKMSHEQLELNKTIINMDELIKEAIDVMNLQLTHAAAQIEYKNPTTKINIAGDKALLINTITTLIDNAIKYNHRQPVIHIQLYREEQEVVIKITDNGIGIEPAFYKKIFAPFFRIPTGNVHDIKGHGLGLSFAAQVVKLHNGTISVASQQNEGSVFTIKLPVS